MERERYDKVLLYVNGEKVYPKPTFKRWCCTIWTNGLRKVLDASDQKGKFSDPTKRLLRKVGLFDSY